MTRSTAAILCLMLAAAWSACTPLNWDRAQTELAQGRLDEAVNDVQAALSSDPDNLKLKNLAAQIFTQRGVKYYQGGQMIGASQDFLTAVSYDPTYAMAYDYLGMIAFQQHNWKDAISYGDKAAGLEGKPDPDYVETARKELRKIQSGGFPPYNPPRRAAHAPSNSY
ncbi:MAG TPA: tetratricopeptide repeat protein [Candidatus Binataceae bacterium]